MPGQFDPVISESPDQSFRPPQVEVRTSARRRKTAGAFWQGERIVVVLPKAMAAADRPAMVDRLVEKVMGHRPHARSSDENLKLRARNLSNTYLDGIMASSVRWVTNQHKRWGSCSPATREIRISHRLRPVPEWVLDGILVHELAHLIEPGHNAEFYRLVHRYPRIDEVDIFLAGFGLGLGMDPELDSGVP